MSVYASNLKSVEGSTLKHAHQQLAGMLANGKFPLALTLCTRRTQADGDGRHPLSPAGIKMTSWCARIALGNRGQKILVNTTYRVMIKS